MAQGERGYLRGRKHKRDLLQTQGKGNAIGAGTCETTGENASVVGLAPGTQAKGERVGHEATKLLGLLLLLICLFLFLLRDLRVPLLAGGSRKPLISALSLNRVALLFHILLAGELVLVTTGHGDGSSSGLLRSFFFSVEENQHQAWVDPGAQRKPSGLVLSLPLQALLSASLFPVVGWWGPDHSVLT